MKESGGLEVRCRVQTLMEAWIRAKQSDMMRGYITHIPLLPVYTSLVLHERMT